MKRLRAAWVVGVAVFLMCALTTTAGARGAGSTKPLRPELVYLYSFETGTGFSPDDVAFSAAGGPQLVIVSAGPAGLFEMTVRGEMGDQYPALGANSITMSTRGPGKGHYFQAWGGGGTIAIYEYAEDFMFVRSCAVSLEGVPHGYPGDAVAFNHYRSTLLVSDLPANLIHEVDCQGDGAFVRSITPVGFAAPAGLTFDVSTGTYYGVLHMECALVQFDDTGALIRWIDLRPYGVQKPIGVTLGQGKMFIADELVGDLHDKTGFIHVFKEPARVR